MAKGKTTVYFCQECGYESIKWMGQCPGCREWNTFVEEIVDKKVAGTIGKMKKENSEAVPVPLSKVEFTETDRTTTRIAELDRVLGGGIVSGSLVLVGGDPGGLHKWLGGLAMFPIFQNVGDFRIAAAV